MLTSSEILVGSKQVSRGIAEGSVRCVIVSLDADVQIINQLLIAKPDDVEVLYAPSKKWLGKVAGIDVGASMVAIVRTVL